MLDHGEPGDGAMRRFIHRRKIRRLHVQEQAKMPLPRAREGNPDDTRPESCGLTCLYPNILPT
jgi:hypothetical protein